ncbi:hypothetical protein IWQ60_011722 [Tieghemiomyces parasiticus]|uniref:Uncharacterized protein n=1 Tax=Tieghemiomyces parasiticus TaxID=78921 RepID=A0A9W8DH15_9FUNG|nr:hypothetical protein IWQ60_011722 [Tieghemiomyces parasiticus]
MKPMYVTFLALIAALGTVDAAPVDNKKPKGLSLTLPVSFDDECRTFKSTMDFAQKSPRAGSPIDHPNTLRLIKALACEEPSPELLTRAQELFAQFSYQDLKALTPKSVYNPHMGLGQVKSDIPTVAQFREMSNSQLLAEYPLVYAFKFGHLNIPILYSSMMYQSTQRKFSRQPEGHAILVDAMKTFAVASEAFDIKDDWMAILNRISSSDEDGDEEHYADWIEVAGNYRG